MLENETGTFHINDVTLPVIRAVVKFCYNAKIDFTDELPAEDVLEVAHKYDIRIQETDFLRSRRPRFTYKYSKWYVQSNTIA